MKNKHEISTLWQAGSAEIDITPSGSVFLYGYPHVPRMSDTVNDPLLASAAAFSDGQSTLLFIACDLIWVPREISMPARQRIAKATGLSVKQIMVTATHTHSGPVVGQMASNLDDTVVPQPDPAYCKQIQDAIVQAGCDAVASLGPASLSQTVVRVNGLGTNRHDPAGPAIPDVPVWCARDTQTGTPIALMCICSMHPTVLHEDSCSISGDFPGLTRRYLQDEGGYGCPFVYHMGAAGNQSPRHVVRHNTLAETERLGQLLGRAIEQGLAEVSAVTPVSVRAESVAMDSLPRRDLPEADEAAKQLDTAEAAFKRLKTSGADQTQVRSAEVDCFGAAETLTLSRLEAQGELDAFAQSCLPAELQVLMLGDVAVVGWPGEVFVEFALKITQAYPAAHVLTLANGGLQGYVVTQEAVQNKAYEAGNALFRSPDVGDMFVSETDRLLSDLLASTPPDSSNARP